MDEFLFLEEEIVEKIKALKKDKYTMKDVDALCELLGLELFWYQKVFVLLNLNEKIFQKEILKST
jgi:hypothetical protein|uniref:Uncharacterized protein n=1 Tax=Bacteriophage sp. TaxID=38018 RepID=A0A8D9PEW7_9VIRU|nr:MAG TPA: hypothetical protein [Bacteriophage sp.]